MLGHLVGIDLLRPLCEIENGIFISPQTLLDPVQQDIMIDVPMQNGGERELRERGNIALQGARVKAHLIADGHQILE